MQANRTIIIKVDSSGNRRKIFEVLHRIVREHFSSLKRADYSTGQDFFGIWNTYFVIDKSEHKKHKEDSLYKALSDLYESNPSLANGYKLIWDGDRLLRKAKDTVESVDRFGEGTSDLNISKEELSSEKNSDLAEGVINIIQNMVGKIETQNEPRVRYLKCFLCDSHISHLGFTQELAKESMRLTLIEKNENANNELMRSIGGECYSCGGVYCSICYQSNDFKCPRCSNKIPHFHGKVG